MRPVWKSPDGVDSLTGDSGLEWLYGQAQQMKSVAEIGVWCGGTTYTLLTGCPGPVFAVDHWLGSPAESDATHKRAKEIDAYGLFMKNVGHFPNLHVCKMPSVEAAKLFPPGSIDMIYIDAGHDWDSVIADVQAWWPICKTLFCGHDLCHGPVRKAIETLGVPFQVNPGDIWSIRK
jgi:hypothetical protein